MSEGFDDLWSDCLLANQPLQQLGADGETLALRVFDHMGRSLRLSDPKPEACRRTREAVKNNIHMHRLADRLGDANFRAVVSWFYERLGASLPSDQA